MSGRSRSRKAHRSRSLPPPDASRSGTGAQRLAWWLVLALLGVTAVVFDATAKDSFRLPKTLAGQSLLLLSLVALSFDWGERVSWNRLAKAPAALAILPFALVATATGLASSHPHHVARGLVGLWIAVAGLWGWSVGFERSQLRRLLAWAIVPGALLAVVAILQFHDVWQPFRFQRVMASSRLAVTSLAGNVGDLAAFLVLPALAGQAALLRRGGGRIASGVALFLLLYGMAITQTFSAFASLVVGSVVLWWTALRRDRRWTALATAITFGLLLVILVAPWRARAEEKLQQLKAGQINSVVTGRLDGWRAAIHMANAHPISGIGLGAFRAEYARTKLELLAEGVHFDRAQPYAIFADAHNEPLQAAAECGWLGLVALGWCLWRVLGRLRGLSGSTTRDGELRSDAALAWAGCAAILVLSMSNFPFRTALVGFPLLVFVSWLFAEPDRGAV